MLPIPLAKYQLLKITQIDFKGFTIDLPQSRIIRMEILSHPFALLEYFKKAYSFLCFVRKIS